MSDEEDEGPSTASDDDSLLRALARAPSQPLPAAGGDDVDPARVAHFKIDGRLGAGGMGVVYRAHDESLRREVAVKLLPAVSSGDPERRQRFLREARVAASLVHPNVAVVYQVGEADGRVYIAMELVEGETLRARLARGPLPPAEARGLALQIAQGLAAAHAKGIVHRDLKPENVMVTPEGVVKLLDFGLAKSGWAHDSDSELAQADTETQLTREGHILGSSAYMSPEQAVGMLVDARSDVFSFGIVLYEMLCRRRPFLGRTLGEMRAAIMREAPLPLDAAVDAGIAAIVTRCLAKRAEERYSDGGVIVLELAAHASASERPLREQAPVPLAPPAGRRRRRRAVIAGVSLAVVTGTAIVALRHHTSEVGARTVEAPLASAAASASPPYDDGANPSKNPEAQHVFEQALMALHRGTGSDDVQHDLDRAVELDSDFGGARLRLALVSADPQAFRRAMALESTLSVRDRVLLDALEAALVRGDRGGVTKQLDDYLERYPRDEWAWFARGLLTSPNATPTAVTSECIPVMERAVAANPAFAEALAWEGYCAYNLGQRERAEVLTERCLALYPRSESCAQDRMELEAQRGACAGVEADARKMLALRPNDDIVRDKLVDALASRGASAEALREARASVEGMTNNALPRALLLPMYDGDFAEVARIASAELTKAQATGGPRAPYVKFLLDAYTESGELAAAADLAEDFARREQGMTDETRGYTSPQVAGLLARALVHGGRISASEGEARIAEAFRALLADRESTMDAWFHAYARLVSSPGEARAAVAAFDSAGASIERDGRFFWFYAEPFVLAGRGESVRPILEEQTKWCFVVHKARTTMRAHLYLGELDEERGEKAPACAHYAKVLERWGHAKPRSVTADEARAHSATLGCAKP